MAEEATSGVTFSDTEMEEDLSGNPVIQEGEEETAEETEPEEKEEKPAPKTKAKTAPDEPVQKEIDEEEESGEEEPEGEEKDKKAPKVEGKGEAKGKEEAKPEDDGDFEVDIETKVDGKLATEKVPLRRLVRSYQIEQASRQAFEQASQMREANTEFTSYFMQDPFSALRQFWTNQFKGDKQKAENYVRALADREAAAYFEEEQLPPHEREIRRLRKEVEEAKGEAERIKNERDEEEIRLKTESFKQRRAKEIFGAIEKIAPETKGKGREALQELARRIDKRMWEEKDRGMEVSALDAAEEIMKERLEYLEGYLKTADVDDILGKFPELEKTVNGRSLQKMKERQAAAVGVSTVPAETDQQQPKRKKVYRTWEELEADTDED